MTSALPAYARFSGKAPGRAPTVTEPTLPQELGPLEDSIEAAAPLEGAAEAAGAGPSAAAAGSRGEEPLEDGRAGLMAKSRRKWQIPASLDIKGLPGGQLAPAAARRANPLLSAAEAVELAAAPCAGAPEGGAEPPRPPEEPRQESADEDEGSPEPARRRDWAAEGVSLSHIISGPPAAANRYRSLVMITQAAYQPVNVVTSDMTTLLQPAAQPGCYPLGLDAAQEAAR